MEAQVPGRATVSSAARASRGVSLPLAGAWPQLRQRDGQQPCTPWGCRGEPAAIFQQPVLLRVQALFAYLPFYFQSPCSPLHPQTRGRCFLWSAAMPCHHPGRGEPPL